MFALFTACFSAYESLPATSFLQGAKIQHFLPICKKKDKKVSDLTFALGQLEVEVGPEVDAQLDVEVGVQVGV